MRKISQRQARYYRKESERLQGILDRQKSRWASGWSPGWVSIEALTLSDASYAKIETARKLNHAIVVVPSSNNRIDFYADTL